MEQNLAPANVTVDHVDTRTNGDKLSVTLMDTAAMIWLSKIDPRLLDEIEIEFAVQIKEGKRLSSLVPQISKSIPGILKRIVDNRGQNGNCVGNTKVLKINELMGEERQKGRNINELVEGQNFNLENQQKPSSQKKSTCGHCKWLQSFWNLPEVDHDHHTEDCKRKITQQTRTILEEMMDEKLQGKEDDFQDNSESQSKEESSSKQSIYRRNSICEDNNDEKHDQNFPFLCQESKVTSNSHPYILSDSEVSKLSVRAVRLSKKASSPKILVTKENRRLVLLIDEGSEINCLDAAFAKKHGVRLENSNNSAKAAGNKSLSITGQTVDDLLVDTLFRSTHVSINLGKATVIRNLGVDMILGEPGKAENLISTDPKNRMIFIDREGKIMSKPYYDPSKSTSYICRIQESRITVYPGEHVEMEVPEHLHNTEIVITPRRQFAKAFEPRIRQVGETVKIKNISLSPINLRRHDQVADIHGTEWAENDSSEEGNPSVNLVHQHSLDKFKFLPKAKKVEPADIDRVKIDPQHQLDPKVRQQFKKVTKQFEHIFTSTPGRYTGAWGDVDTTLQFSQPPVQTRKVAVPNYSHEMKQKMATKMDELIEAGVLMTPEEVGISVEFVSPSMLVPKTEADSWRLVTDFTQINRFIKRFTSTNPTIDEARKDLSRKKLFAEIDLSNYFFQGGLNRKDCAWLGVQHPYKGIFVYTASPQGLKNSSEFSYDRLGRVYGDMVQEGRMTRMADGLYPMGDTGEELL